MTQLGMSPGQQRVIIRTTQNPLLRLNPRIMREFNRPGYADPEALRRMQELRQ
jgi:hypothetical protein